MKRTSLASIWILAGVASGIAFVVSCDTTASSHAQGVVEDELQQHHKAPRPEKVITADSDPNQLVAGSRAVGFDATTFLVSGPLVVSDVEVVWGWSAALATELWLQPNDGGAECDGTGQLLFASMGEVRNHGTRLFVPAGRNLCVHIEQASSFRPPMASWSGFKPY
jgi:hypothetical protein